MLQHNLFNENEPSSSAHHKSDSKQFHIEKLQDGLDDFEAKRKQLIVNSMVQNEKRNTPKKESENQEENLRDGTFMF